MLDDRWSPDAAELAAGLRGLLEKSCGTEAVRAAERSEDGRDPSLEEKLGAFGLWELPATAETLAVASWEIGRALAPIPYVEMASVHAVLGVRGATSALDGPAPVPPTRTVVTDPEGRLLVVETGPARRSTAGDLLADARSPLSSDDVVGGQDDADRLRRFHRLLAAARVTGAAERLLEIGVDYAKRRTQFGRPIGAFQAVAHRLADAAIARDGATLLVRKAAWVADEAQRGDGAPSWPFATMAWGKAVDAGRFVASAVHQCMGGYGFTLEEDCQLFSRRIRSWTLRLPAPGPELATLARSLLDPAKRDEIRFLWHHDRGVPLPRWAVDTNSALGGA